MLVTAGIALSLCLPFQDDAGSAAARRDAEFARALVRELEFDDLAETVIDRALGTAKSSEDQGVLLLARCEVRKLTAQVNKDVNPVSRLESFSRAAEAYGEFLDTDPPSDLALPAQRDLAETTFFYGRTLRDHIETGGLASGRDELTGVAENVFQTGLRASNDLIGWWEGNRDSDARDATRLSIYFPTLYFRSMTYFYWSLLYDHGTLERNENSRKAIQYLEEFALKVGEISVAGLRAYRVMGEAYGLRDEEDSVEDAEAFLEHVIENAIPEDVQLPPAEIELRQEVIQEAYLGMLRLWVRLGRLGDASRLGTTFNQWVEDADVLLARDGYRFLLQNALLMADEGRAREALDLTRLVADENQASLLRLEANAVEGQIIGLLPADAEVDVAVLYGAAEGAYFQERYPDAIELFKRVIPHLADSADGDEYGGKTYYYLARSWTSLDRLLEAAVTHQSGYELYPDDEEFGSRNAENWHRVAEVVAARNRGDAALEAWRDEAFEARSASGDGATPDAPLWRAASADYNAAKRLAEASPRPAAGSAEAREATEALNKAASSLRRLQQGSQYYERALVNLGMVEFLKMPFEPAAADRAFKAFDDYLENYLQDPNTKPVDARGRKSRKESHAKADYYRAMTRAEQAKAGNTARWNDALQLFDGYLERHPEQRSFGAAAIVERISGFIALGRLDDAITEYEKLIGANLSTGQVRRGAFQLFNHYNKAAVAGGATPENRPNLVEAAKYLNVMNSLGTPARSNMLREGKLRLDLGEANTSATILEQVMQRFGNDASFTGRERFFAEMNLIEAYLAQDKTGQAEPLIQGQLEQRPKNLQVIQAATKVLAGWIEVRDGRVTEVPGKGTKEAFDQADGLISTLIQLADKAAGDEGKNRYAYRPYWEAVIQQVYTIWKRSSIDTAYRGQHKEKIRFLRSLAPDLGAGVSPDLPQLITWLEQQP